jgi:hypothetical protein
MQKHSISCQRTVEGCVLPLLPCIMSAAMLSCSDAAACKQLSCTCASPAQSSGLGTGQHRHQHTQMQPLPWLGCGLTS